MTQEFKTLEEIKEELAKEWKFKSWRRMMDADKGIIDDFEIDAVANLYAKQFQDANNQQLEEYASFEILIKSMEDRIKHLQQSNKELVEMLENIAKLLESDSRISIESIHRIIAKHKQS